MENQTTPVLCKDCQKPLEVGESPELGDVIVCKECGAELEIVGLDPMELDYLMVQK